MHYVCHRSENKHSTSLPAPILSLYPWRHCLSCLYVGPVAWSLWICLLFVASPGKSHGQWSFDAARSRFFSLLHFTPSNCQSAWHTKTEEDMRKKKVMPFSVSTLRWDQDWKRVRLLLFRNAGTDCYFTINSRSHHPSKDESAPKPATQHLKLPIPPSSIHRGYFRFQSHINHKTSTCSQL